MEASLVSCSSGDPKCVELKGWALQVVDEGFGFNNRFVAQEGWGVVPVESALHFDELDIASLSGAMERNCTFVLYAILIEDMLQAEECLRFSADSGGLARFSRECSHACYALCPPDKSFCVVCTVFDYFLVAGPPEFLESAFPDGVIGALEAFADFAGDEAWPKLDRERLLAVLDRCR